VGKNPKIAIIDPRGRLLNYIGEREAAALLWDGSAKRAGQYKGHDAIRMVAIVGSHPTAMSYLQKLPDAVNTTCRAWTLRHIPDDERSFYMRPVLETICRA